MVIIQGMQWISAGLLLGLIASFPLMRLLRNQLYQVSAADPFTFVWASVFFVTIALIACWLPARRGKRRGNGGFAMSMTVKLLKR